MSKEKTNKEPVLSANLFPVVGIGASAGGLDAFKKFLKAIPEQSGMAYVLVQHLDPRHESLLPDILKKVTKIPIAEITDDIKVQPDHIYIIPSNKMLVATDGVLQLSPRPTKTKNEQNLPVDLFFTSLAEVHQAHAIGVILSGTASDGTRGLKAIKDQGGLTFAQDEASAQYGGMPHSAVEAGVVDFILPPGDMPAKLIEIIGQLNRMDKELQTLDDHEDEVFRQILALLRLRKGNDFTYYKQTTVRRRILRRMALNKNEGPAAYLKFLREHKTEQDILYQDLLIPVTGFFRDSKSFDNLCETVFPAIIKSKPGNEPIRVWVAGCSTGEEAFSIAICIKEFLNSEEYVHNKKANIHSDTRVQIFATDISEPAIAKGRKGLYSKADIEGLSLQRQQDFFSRVNGSYQVNKNIRDMCVFAVHNFLKDPPFAKMDLVSCRNVLIYMEPYLQKKALTTFHYALTGKGFLLLGKSETSSSVPDLFSTFSKNDKLFSRKDVPSKYMHVASQRSEQIFRDIDTNTKTEGRLTDFQKNADDILLSRFTPAGVVVNESMEIVHFRGSTGSYLEPSPGKANFNLLKMIKEGLAFELRNILHKAKTENEPALKENIPVDINGTQRIVTIEAIPLRNVIEPHYLVLFHDNNPVSVNQKKAARSKGEKNGFDEKDLRIQQLEKELAQTREDMRTITEDQEAANEELQSANEELLSGSEELQSLNEEMETSKEELQSTNEELVVINQEMISLNEEITEARNYAEAIVSTIREPLIILDKNLRVKSANESFYKTFMVSESETEGNKIFSLGNGQWNQPALVTLLENIIPNKERFSDYEVRYQFPNIGERIMLLNAREIRDESGGEKLILLATEDVTEKRLSENMLEESERKFRSLADFVPQIIWTAQPDGMIDYNNRQWFSFTQFKDGQTGQSWISLLHKEDEQECIDAWNMSIQNGTSYQAECRFKDIKTGIYRWFLAKASPIKNIDGTVKKWFGSFTDIHEQKMVAAELLIAKELAESSARAADDAVKSKQQFLSNMSHEIRTPMNSIIGFTKVLLRTPLTAIQREYLNSIKMSGDIMTLLVNDILDLAKVEAGKMIFERIPFSLEDNLSSMLHLFKIKLQEKNIELIKQYDHLIPKVLSGDLLRLHQVILNLMSNAIKFTSKGKITIGVRMLKEEPEKVTLEFTIADTGIGIPEEKLSLIFDNFGQAHNDSTRLSPGTGLGLSIVKKLIEAQGGTIGVKSKLKVGTAFNFILTFHKTDEQPATVSDDALMVETSGSNIRILVVEDIELNQLLMKTLLTDFGFQAEIAGNGKIAIEKLKKGIDSGTDSYDIILMDLQMPEMNGYETTVCLRNELQLGIPVIALTAEITQEAIERCKAVGMNDYISKPVDENLLIHKIMNLLELPPRPHEDNKEEKQETTKEALKVTNLAYLRKRTKSDNDLLIQMIRIFLEQTPSLLSSMKTAIANADWPLLHAATHKLLPSLTIMGFDDAYQLMGKKVQDYQGGPDQANAISETIGKIEIACTQAFKELQDELINMNIE